MSLVYWLSKFSQEAMLVEIFLIGCIGVGYFGYLLIKKRRYGAAKNNIPDNVVRAFLIELISSAEGFRRQLFGELGKGGTANMTPEAAAQMQAQMGVFFSQNSSLAQAAGLSGIAATPEAFAAAAAAAGIGPTGAAGTGGADVTALKTQLASAVQKTDELTKTIAQLNAEKANLEKAGAGSGAAGGDNGKQLADLNEKISKLESKLTEYEVIEDDLANLKKYQQENKQLKAQLEALQKGAPAPVAAPTEVVAAAPVAEAPIVEAPVAEAPAVAEAAPAVAAAEPSPIAAAEATVAETKATESFDTLVDKVEESLAPTPTGASVSDPVVEQQAKTTAPVADAPAVLDAAVAGGAAPLEPKQEKTDADLLNEFERMLSS